MLESGGSRGADPSWPIAGCFDLYASLCPLLKKKEPLMQGHRDPSPQSFKLSPLECPIQTI